MNYGEILELFQDESTGRFEWIIPDYLTLQPGRYSSPAVKYFNMIWNLELRREANDTFKDGVYLHREIATSGTVEPVVFVISYRRSDGDVDDVIRNKRFPDCAREWGRYLRMRTPRFNYSSDHTITCTMWKDDRPRCERVSRDAQTEDASCSNGRKGEPVYPGFGGFSRETQTEDGSFTEGRNDEHHSKGISVLSEHFENLLLSGDHHDVHIKIKDKQFRAHKCVLARSPVFSAMFSSKMAESTGDSVTIDDCDPDAFGEFLRYIYTGKVDISSTGHALGLYYAADKYDFSKLKELCVGFLRNSITTTTIADVIRVAARHSEEELLQQAVLYFSKNLEEVMQTAEWRCFILDNPVLGNEMCLKAVRCLMTCLDNK